MACDSVRPSIGAAVVIAALCGTKDCACGCCGFGAGWLPGMGTGAFCCVPTGACCCPGGGVDGAGGVCAGAPGQRASHIVSKSGLMERVQYIDLEMNGG